MVIYNSFKKMLSIQILSAVTAFLNIFIDSIVISRFLGTVSMASFGFAEPTVLIITAVSMIFMVGTQGIAGRLLGKGDIDGVNEIVSLVLSILIVLTIIFSVSIFVFSDTIALFFGASGETFIQTSAYLRGLAPGIIAMFIGPTLTCLMQIDNDLKRSFYSIAVMTILNVIFDLVNVYFIHWGMFGMGIATTLSGYVNVVIILFHFIRKDIMLHPNFKHIKFKMTKDVILIGLPAAIQQMCLVVRTAVLNIMLFGIAGNLAVAAFTIQNGIIPLVMAVINGVGMTTILVSGAVIGEEDRYSLKELMIRIFRLAFIISIIIFAIVFVFAKGITLFFVTASEVQEILLVTKVLKIYAISIPFCMIVTLFVNYLQSMQKLILANVIYVCEVTLFVIVVAFILSKIIGIDGIFIAFIISEILSLVLIFVVVAVNKKGIPSKFEDLLMMPDSFGVCDDDRINITATNEVEATEISKNIMSFCEKHGIDKKRSLYSALSMEEMSVLTLQNNKDNKIPCKVDVFVVKKGDDLKISLKDNGKIFNPEAQRDLLNPDDKASNIAIRMFYSIVKDVKYRDLFGLNVISFKI